MNRYLIFILLLASCNTVAKQQRKAETFYNAHPEKLALQCVNKFPPDTLYKQGQTIVVSDTTIIKGDSVPCPPVVNTAGDTVFVKVKCPDSRIIRDTVTRIDTLTQIDNVKIFYLSYKADSLKTELIKSDTLLKDKREANKRATWISIGLAAALLISIFLNLKKIT